MNASTGEPLKKAQVTLDKDGDESDKHAFYTITDATGHFSIHRMGYLTARYGQGSQPDRRGAVFTPAAGQKISDLLFRMHRL